MSCTEYFSVAAQPRDHLRPHTRAAYRNHTITHLRLSTTTNNLFAFNTSDLSSNTSEKLWLLADKYHYKLIFLSSYSSSRMLLVVCRLSRDVIGYDDS